MKTFILFLLTITSLFGATGLDTGVFIQNGSSSKTSVVSRVTITGANRDQVNANNLVVTNVTASLPAKFSASKQITSGAINLSGTEATGTIADARVADTAVTPGTYGDSTHVGQFTVDQKGRLTAASSVAISASGGTSVLVNGTSVTNPNFTNSSTATFVATAVTNITVNPTNIANAQISASAAIDISKLSGAAASATTISAGAGLSGGGSLAANRTLTLDGTTFVNNFTLWDSSQASRTWTAGLSGATDPVWTFSNNSADLTTGVLKYGGNTVATLTAGVLPAAQFPGLTGDVTTAGGALATTIANSAVTTAKIAANAVDGTKIALGSDAQGDVMYYNGTDYVRLAAGTSGRFLQTQGAGANPQWAVPSGAGDFVGPGSSTDNAIVRFDGTTGKLGQNSGVTIDDSDNLSVPGTITTGTGSTLGSFQLGDSDNSNAIRWQATNAMTTNINVIGPVAPYSGLLYWTQTAAGSSNVLLNATNTLAGLNTVLGSTIIDTASISDTAYASSWNGVTTIAPSKNAVYDWGHTFDTDDDGKVNVLDMGAGLVKTDSGGVVSAAVSNTDYAPAADAIFTSSLQLPNGAAPTTDAFGEIAGDNNAWAASRGAVQFYDGTANTYLVGTLASDTPSNGQVPTWNTGGTITWETPAGGGTVTASGGALTANALVLGAGTTDTKVVAGLTTDGTDKITLGTVDFGGNTDTTVSRASAGDIAVEGNRIFRVGGADVPVADGGTGISSGTSGGILGYTASGTLASSAALAANAIVIGGGAGATPTTTTTGTGNLTALGNNANATGGFATTDGTATFTGKTYDAGATGNTLKQIKSINLQRPDYGDGAGAVPQTNTFTASGLMHYTFSGNAETNVNWVVYEFDCPPDLDTGVDLTARFAFLSGGTDTDDYVFHITYSQVAAGTAYPTGTGISTSPIVITVTPTTPANGDLQYSAATTLTGWAASLTPGRAMLVRIARLQNAQDDGARDVQLVLTYGSTL